MIESLRMRRKRDQAFWGLVLTGATFATQASGGFSLLFDDVVAAGQGFAGSEAQMQWAVLNATLRTM